MFLHSYILIVCLFLVTPFSFADEGPTARPDAHAPIGVMADHMHKKGEWMASYRYMKMDMNQNFSGTKEITVEQASGDFALAPVNMRMEMHMVGLMYGVTDDVTAVLMLPYVTKDMEHRRKSDQRQFSTRSAGLGDVSLSAMYSLLRTDNRFMHLNFGVSFPSGSISREDTTLAGDNRPLPYPMQLGSGTYDLLPGLTYYETSENWSWGVQYRSTVRLGKNDRNYALGDRFGLTSWVAYKWSDWLSTSIRLDGQKWGNVSGADQRLNVNMVQTADPDRQGGQRIDILFGANFIGQEGIWRDQRVALEAGFPIYQDLNGTQLGVGWLGTVGWQKAW